MTALAVSPPITRSVSLMHRIIESLLSEFSQEHELDGLTEEKQFEHFCSFIAVKRHFGEVFNTYDIVTGGSNDTGIDGIAIIANGSLITDLDFLEELSTNSDYLDVTFIFVQCERSESFSSASIGTFGYGLTDFFNNGTPRLPRNEKVAAAAEIMKAIYDRSNKFKHSNPICRLYYATTGKWKNEDALTARRDAIVSDLKDTGLLSEVVFTPAGADDLQRLYRQTKNAISKKIEFKDKMVMPDIPGVNESYLGTLPASEFLKLLKDESGEMLRVLFYDNVRDWLDFNDVNNEIKATLEKAKSRFVLMNNGVTIIARSLQVTGNKVNIEDYSIVNGCQTSHVLFEQRDIIDDSVMIPVRLIGTQDEDVINAIVRGTNRQTPVKEEQFYALEDFSKELESYFKTYQDQYKLYYERRTGQYVRLNIGPTRIVTPAKMIKAFAAMFLEEPHRATKNYTELKGKIGKEIFAEGHRMEPYYAAAFALYRLELLFRNVLDTKYKPARYHLLMVARIISNPGNLPRMNSHEMERYGKKIIEILGDANKSSDLFVQAAKIIDDVADGNYERDNIGVEPFTKGVIARAKEIAQG